MIIEEEDVSIKRSETIDNMSKIEILPSEFKDDLWAR